MIVVRPLSLTLRAPDASGGDGTTPPHAALVLHGDAAELASVTALGRVNTRRCDGRMSMTYAA